MAKRTPRSEAPDTTQQSKAPSADSAARPKKSRRAPARRGAVEGDAAVSAPTSAAAATEDTFAARADDASVSHQPPVSAPDASSSETRSDSMASEPSEEQIRQRAYQRYLERGGADGRHFEDWLEAEKELKANQ